MYGYRDLTYRTDGALSTYSIRRQRDNKTGKRRAVEGTHRFNFVRSVGSDFFDGVVRKALSEIRLAA